MTRQPDLSARVALVTGGSRGIGRAIALALAQAGAAVAVNYRERADEAASVVEAIRASGGRGIAVAADVSLRAPVAEMIARVERELGAVDVLVNNAGIAITGGPGELSEEDFDRTIAVNLKSAFLCTEAVLPGMRARRWGRIVNISSGAARGGGVVGVHYNASKAGLEGLTRGYAVRLAKEGITGNAVAPGPVDTEMAEPLKQTDILAKIPVGRFGTVNEVADAVLMVVGNGFITGQTIPVNGGIVLI
jgi:3-oxoacyl-[acyl-carrier protein] reductase